MIRLNTIEPMAINENDLILLEEYCEYVLTYHLKSGQLYCSYDSRKHFLEDFRKISELCNLYVFDHASKPVAVAKQIVSGIGIRENNIIALVGSYLLEIPYEDLILYDYLDFLA